MKSNGGYNFAEIGLVKVKNPICTLAVMVSEVLLKYCYLIQIFRKKLL